MFRYLLALVIPPLLLGGSLPAQAQSTGFVDPSLATELESSFGGPLQCFDYYKFGSVSADLQSNVAEAVPGSLLTFSGLVVNQNDYPVVNGRVYVKIFKDSEDTFAAGDGNPVVDQFIVSNQVAIDANGSVPMSYSWHVPTNAEAGSYYAAYFFITDERYNLLGLSFTDDVVGNRANFTVISDNAPIATLQKTDTTLNGQDHRFATFPLHFKSDETVTIETTIKNPSEETKTMPLQWTQYAWDGQYDGHVRNTDVSLITLAPFETKKVSYEVKPQREAIVFVTATTQDGESKSFLNIRYVRDGVEETRINFPSLTKFPLVKGEEQLLFACAHSTNVPIVPGNTLSLVLKDNTGSVIHSYRYDGDIVSDMAGFGENFTPTEDYNEVVLEASLERNGVTVEKVAIEYDCKDINPESCLINKSGGTDKNSMIDKYLLLGVLLAVAVIALVFFLLIRKRNEYIDAGTPLASLVFALLLSSLTFGIGAQLVEANSASWSSPALPPLLSYETSGNFCYANCGNIDIDRWATIRYKWVPVGYLQNGALVSVQHSSVARDAANNVISNGTVLNVGDTVRFQPAANSGTDISWFGTGGFGDSPFGVWSAGSPTACDPTNFVSTDNFTSVTVQDYIALHVTPTSPTITQSGTAGLTCGAGGFTCTVTSPGTIIATVSWPATSGKFYFSYDKTGQFQPSYQDWTGQGCRSGTPFKTVPAGCPAFSPVNSDPHDCLGNGADYLVQVPTQRITHNFVAVAAAANRPPVMSPIQGPPTGLTGTSYSFLFQARDPDGDTLQYGIDWDNNGMVDTWTTPLVLSNTLVSSAQSWFTTGSKTFKALARDSKNLSSGWVSHSITISNPPPGSPSVNFTINGSAGPLTVSSASTLNMAWTGTNVSSCTAFGPGWNKSLPTTTGVDSIQASISTTYLVSCASAVGNKTDTVDVVVQNQPPVMQPILGNNNAIATIAETYTIVAIDPDGNDVSYEVDWDNDGIADQPASGPTASGVSQTINHPWPAAGTYTFQVRAIDTLGAISAWVSKTVIVAPPPPATATLEVSVNGGAWSTGDPTINPGDTVRVRWRSTSATTCTGTNFNTAGATNNNVGVLVNNGLLAPGTTLPLTLRCSGAGGNGSDTVSVTIRDLPNLTTPSISVVPNLASFDPVTGAYGSVSVSFTTGNNGGSNSAATNYRLILTDRNGARGPRTGTINALAAGASHPVITLTESNVLFGLITVEVWVDWADSVTEGDESDNYSSFNYDTGLPNPNIDITADKIVVRSGDSAMLSWDTKASYPMNCSVFGPTISTYTFDPSVDGPTGTLPTGALSTKSNFVLECTEPITSKTFSDTVSIEIEGLVEEI
ncbi:MAG: PKD domain-containing protein [Patescibacteria group bacterium]